MLPNKHRTRIASSTVWTAVLQIGLALKMQSILDLRGEVGVAVVIHGVHDSGG